MGNIVAFRGENRFLSNFYEKPLFWQGFWRPTAEHAYQASKTEIAEDMEPIRNAASPMLAKKLGRAATPLPGWEDSKTIVMMSIVRAKFTDQLEMGPKLEATGDAFLIEGNNWGMVNGIGENQLGKTLMRIRSENRLLGRHWTQ